MFSRKKIALLAVTLVGLFFARRSSASTGSVDQPEYTTVEVPVTFVGDRQLRQGSDHSVVYQVINGQHIRFGRVVVPLRVPTSTLPNDQTLQKLGWKRRSAELRITQVSIKEQVERTTSVWMNYGASVRRMTPFLTPLFKNFLEDFQSTLESSRFILFVHGCCISAETSFVRAAEISYSSRLPVLMFDWATPGKLEAPLLPEIHTYRQSERILEISQHNYHEFISAISSFTKSDCILVGHSMGNRLICSDLLQRHSKRELFFEQIHLIRPDLSLPAFILQEGRICQFSKRLYVYMSRSDKELAKAQFLSAKVPRLGMADKRFFDQAASNMTFDLPSNRYFLDISALKLTNCRNGHCIPLELLSKVIRNGLIPSERFDFKPLSDHHTMRQVVCVTDKK